MFTLWSYGEAFPVGAHSGAAFLFPKDEDFLIRLGFFSHFVLYTFVDAEPTVINCFTWHPKVSKYGAIFGIRFELTRRF